MQRPATLGELRASGYQPCRVKDEIRRNLLKRLATRQPLFTEMVGYESTVLPELTHALLARHDLLLLGTRGQGKTRLLRQLVDLLDEWVPAVAGTDLRDDPLAPISAHALELIARHGDQTPVVWLSRQDRYLEKLATPDVTMTDLFGDVDLRKHVEGRSLAEEGALHFGLIPRANRGIFCINELPDLSPRIQVGLFNLLQERDVQIRGYPVRFALDVCLVFSANPEDYTSRGRIVTPLKDRIGSVVRTHYPASRAEGIAITDSNVVPRVDGIPVQVPHFLKEVIEELVRRARSSPAVNQQSGVSARLAISARELLVSCAERRALLLGETEAVARVSDLSAVFAGARGKLELLLDEEGGQEDRLVADLLREAIRIVFTDLVPLERLQGIRDWFTAGNRFTVGESVTVAEILAQLQHAEPLLRCVRELLPPTAATPAWLASGAEFLLEGLHLYGQLNKQRTDQRHIFGK